MPYCYWTDAPFVPADVHAQSPAARSVPCLKNEVYLQLRPSGLFPQEVAAVPVFPSVPNKRIFSSCVWGRTRNFSSELPLWLQQALSHCGYGIQSLGFSGLWFHRLHENGWTYALPCQAIVPFSPEAGTTNLYAPVVRMHAHIASRTVMYRIPRFSFSDKYPGHSRPTHWPSLHKWPDPADRRRLPRSNAKNEAVPVHPVANSFASSVPYERNK